MRFTNIISSVIAVLTMLIPVVSNAVILEISGGQLMGAKNVEVNGTKYDVSFVDGTCIAIFDGCDEVSDFTFHTQADATAASEVLMNTVFVDGPLGDFDTRPDLTNGITVSWTGWIWTAYGFSGANYWSGMGVENWDANAWSPSDSVVQRNDAKSRDFSNDDWHVWAVWSNASGGVPVSEPSILFLLLSGLVGFTVLQKRSS